MQQRHGFVAKELELQDSLRKLHNLEKDTSSEPLSRSCGSASARQYFSNLHTLEDWLGAWKIALGPDLPSVSEIAVGNPSRVSRSLSRRALRISERTGVQMSIGEWHNKASEAQPPRCGPQQTLAEKQASPVNTSVMHRNPLHELCPKWNHGEGKWIPVESISSEVVFSSSWTEPYIDPMRASKTESQPLATRRMVGHQETAVGVHQDNQGRKLLPANLALDTGLPCTNLSASVPQWLASPRGASVCRDGRSMGSETNSGAGPLSLLGPVSGNASRPTFLSALAGTQGGFLEVTSCNRSKDVWLDSSCSLGTTCSTTASRDSKDGSLERSGSSASCSLGATCSVTTPQDSNVCLENTHAPPLDSISMSQDNTIDTTSKITARQPGMQLRSVKSPTEAQNPSRYDAGGIQCSVGEQDAMKCAGHLQGFEPAQTWHDDVLPARRGQEGLPSLVDSPPQPQHSEELDLLTGRLLNCKPPKPMNSNLQGNQFVADMDIARSLGQSSAEATNTNPSQDPMNVSAIGKTLQSSFVEPKFSPHCEQRSIHKVRTNSGISEGSAVSYRYSDPPTQRCAVSQSSTAGSPHLSIPACDVSLASPPNSPEEYGPGHYVPDPYLPGTESYVIPNQRDLDFNPYYEPTVNALNGVPAGNGRPEAPIVRPGLSSTPSWDPNSPATYNGLDCKNDEIKPVQSGQDPTVTQVEGKPFQQCPSLVVPSSCSMWSLPIVDRQDVGERPTLSLSPRAGNMSASGVSDSNFAPRITLQENKGCRIASEFNPSLGSQARVRSSSPTMWVGAGGAVLHGVVPPNATSVNSMNPSILSRGDCKIGAQAQPTRTISRTMSPVVQPCEASAKECIPWDCQIPQGLRSEHAHSSSVHSPSPLHMRFLPFFSSTSSTSPRDSLSLPAASPSLVLSPRSNTLISPRSCSNGSPLNEQSSTYCINSSSNSKMQRLPREGSPVIAMPQTYVAPGVSQGLQGCLPSPRSAIQPVTIGTSPRELLRPRPNASNQSVGLPCPSPAEFRAPTQSVFQLLHSDDLLQRSTSQHSDFGLHATKPTSACPPLRMVSSKSVDSSESSVPPHNCFCFSSS